MKGKTVTIYINVSDLSKLSNKVLLWILIYKQATPLQERECEGDND